MKTKTVETVSISPLQMEVNELTQKIEILKNGIELSEYVPPVGVVIQSDNDFYKQLKAGLENKETRQQTLQIKALTLEEIKKLEIELETKIGDLRIENLNAELDLVREAMRESGKELNAILDQTDPIIAKMNKLTSQAIALKQKIKPYPQETGQGSDQFRYYVAKKLYRVGISSAWVSLEDHSIKPGVTYLTNQREKIDNGERILGITGSYT